MAYIHPKDRVLEHSTTSGAGPWAVSGAIDASFNAFSASMSVGDTTIGTIVEPGVAFWSGVLTYSATNQITATGSAFESKGTFGSGTKEIFMGGPASRTPLRTSNNIFDGTQNFTNATEATGAGTTASALFAGGVEIAKKLFVVGAASFASTLAITAAAAGLILTIDQNSAGAGSASVNAASQISVKGYAGGNTAYAGIRFAMYEHTSGWGSDILGYDDTGAYGGGLIFRTGTGAATATPTERMRISGNGPVTFAASAAVTINSTTTATSTTTGALIVGGGAGFAGSVFVGGNANVTGTFTSNGAITQTSSGAQTLSVISTVSGDVNIVMTAGGAGIARLTASSNIWLKASSGGTVFIERTTVSTSTTNGALVVNGGLGVVGALYATNIASTSDAIMLGRVFLNSASDICLGTELNIYGSGSSNKMAFYAIGGYRFNLGAGTMTTDGAGNVIITSDETLKIVRADFKRGLSAIRGITPKLYSWNKSSGNETEGVYAGFVAQDVLKYVPEAIGKSINGKLTLQDRPLIAALVNAVKEMADKIDDLETRCAA